MDEMKVIELITKSEDLRETKSFGKLEPESLKIRIDRVDSFLKTVKPSFDKGLTELEKDNILFREDVIYCLRVLIKGLGLEKRDIDNLLS